jgi:hypothetical protein
LVGPFGESQEESQRRVLVPVGASSRDKWEPRHKPDIFFLLCYRHSSQPTTDPSPLLTPPALLAYEQVRMGVYCADQEGWVSWINIPGESHSCAAHLHVVSLTCHGVLIPRARQVAVGWMLLFVSGTRRSIYLHTCPGLCTTLCMYADQAVCSNDIVESFLASPRYWLSSFSSAEDITLFTNTHRIKDIANLSH